MKILLVGPGAVGTYFCGRLAQHGVELEVVARSHADLIAANGYQVESDRPEGDFHFSPNRVIASAAECSPDIDAIVVALKILPEIDTASLIAPAANLPHHPPVVLIQNGIGIEEPVAAAFPGNTIISTIAYIGGTRPAPGVVRQRGSARLRMGVYQGQDESFCKNLVDEFVKAKVDCSYSSDIRFDRWNKLLWNLAFNTVSVIGGNLTTAQMCDHGAIESLCRNLMSECAAVARAAGVALDDTHIDAQIEFTRKFPPYKTSTLQDFEAKRPLECEAIIGNAVRIAGKYNVDIPVMRSCYALLVSRNQQNLIS